MPSKYIGLAGAEIWGAWGWQGASWRLHAEYADTAVDSFFGSQPSFDTAYTHHIYTDGYTYRGRIIGHSLGGDGRMHRWGFYMRPQGGGKAWDVLLRRIEPERDVATSPSFLSVELGHRLTWWNHTISLRGGAVRSQSPSGTDIEGQMDA